MQSTPLPVIVEPVSSLALCVRDLTVGFRIDKSYVERVHGVSFDLERGKTLALVGESGSGKTLTSMAIMGLLGSRTAVIGGVAEVDGIDVTKARGRALRQIRGTRIAMVYQDPASSLNPLLTIGTQLCEALACHTKMPKSEIRRRGLELLRQIRLPNPDSLFKAYPHQLSGGMKQRVVIAMAIALNPTVLIADEPTTALDVTVQQRILWLIKELQEQLDMAVLFVTHDLAVVAEVADEVAVMKSGEIIEHATVLDLFEHPSAQYSRELLRAATDVYRRDAHLDQEEAPRP